MDPSRPVNADLTEPNQPPPGMMPQGMVPQDPINPAPMNVAPGTPNVAIQEISKEAMGDEATFHNRIPQRRSFIDLTAQPWFSHSPDYSTLSGQLKYNQADKSWQLRYASVDENDSYGGEVALVNNPQLDMLKDGQYLRVQGVLVDPDKKEYCTPYKVASFQPVERPHADAVAQKPE